MHWGDYTSSTHASIDVPTSGRVTTTYDGMYRRIYLNGNMVFQDALVRQDGPSGEDANNFCLGSGSVNSGIDRSKSAGMYTEGTITAFRVEGATSAPAGWPPGRRRAAGQRLSREPPLVPAAVSSRLGVPSAWSTVSTVPNNAGHVQHSWHCRGTFTSGCPSTRTESDYCSPAGHLHGTNACCYRADLDAATCLAGKDHVASAARLPDVGFSVGTAANGHASFGSIGGLTVAATFQAAAGYPQNRAMPILSLGGDRYWSQSVAATHAPGDAPRETNVAVYASHGGFGVSNAYPSDDGTFAQGHLATCAESWCRPDQRVFRVQYAESALSAQIAVRAEQNAFDPGDGSSTSSPTDDLIVADVAWSTSDPRNNWAAQYSAGCSASDTARAAAPRR